MRRMLVLLLLCLVAPRAEARAQLFESSRTWEVAERSGARVLLTWRDTSAFNVDFGRGRYGVAYRDHESYVGAAQLESGDVAIFRLTGFGDGEARVAWRDSWVATSERTEHWVAASGVTRLFDGPPMAAGAEPWPADDPTSTPYEEPRVRLRVDPVMPDIAKEAGVTGTVVMRVLVGRSGGVRSVRVVKSIPMLDAAAVACVKQWAFEPLRRGEKPVAGWAEVRVRFELK